MSDPKYNTYAGELRFDDDNIVDVNLQPDTENITVLLNGEEVTGGSSLPEVTSEDNGDVLTVVSGEWTNAAPASQLPAVSGSDNGNVLTVVEGSWAKAAPAGGGGAFFIDITTDTSIPPVITVNKTFAQIKEAYESGSLPVLLQHEDGDETKYVFHLLDLMVTNEQESMANQYFAFSKVTVEVNDVQSTLYIISYDDTISVYESAYPNVV